MIRHSLTTCPHCAQALSEAALVDVVKRQVFDIPEPRIEVTEHQVEVKHCCGCGKQVQAKFPEEVRAPVQYGQRIQSLSIYFQHQQLIPEDRVQQMFWDIFKLPITTATIVSFGQTLSQRLNVFMEGLLSIIESSARKHLDETGFRIGGKTHWLHVASNAQATYYHVSPKRKSLLTGLRGIVCHDHSTVFNGT